MNRVQDYPATEFTNTQQRSSGLPSNRVQELSLSNRVQLHSATDLRNAAAVFRNCPELGTRIQELLCNRVQELLATDFRNSLRPSAGILSNQVQGSRGSLATEFKNSQQ